MLFNSYVFLFVYLPLALAGFFLFARAGRRPALAWLTAASLFFYGWWNPYHIPLILFSITFNYFTGRFIVRATAGSRRSRFFLAAGILVNLALLGWFKYAGFFAGLAGWRIAEIVLPLGISFFTFTQIAYLVDCQRGSVREYDFLQYALFVTFFPHLLAGPILHHGELIPQFSKQEVYRPDAFNTAQGAMLFFLGLCKKVLIADQVAIYAAPVFTAVSAGARVSFFDAWAGAVAYAFQIYFDFSGYSDMAIGLALFFSIRLPINFNSPYKARNVVEFWRRWHMTLSRFLRDYLYIPLGGNRRGKFRRHLNLLVTMIVGGFWHGAGWTFIAWGTLHGIFLVWNHAWGTLMERIGFRGFGRPGRVISVTLTFLFVTVAWIFFRADSLEAALHFLGGMAGANGFVLPDSYQRFAGSAGWIRFQYSSLWPGMFGVLFLAAAGGIVWFAPNTQELLDYRFGKDGGRPADLPAFLSWKPSVRWAFALALAAAFGIAGISRQSEFLYFRF